MTRNKNEGENEKSTFATKFFHKTSLQEQWQRKSVSSLKYQYVDEGKHTKKTGNSFRHWNQPCLNSISEGIINPKGIHQKLDCKKKKKKRISPSYISNNPISKLSWHYKMPSRLREEKNWPEWATFFSIFSAKITRERMKPRMFLTCLHKSLHLLSDIMRSVQMRVKIRNLTVSGIFPVNSHRVLVTPNSLTNIIKHYSCSQLHFKDCRNCNQIILPIQPSKPRKSTSQGFKQPAY